MSDKEEYDIKKSVSKVGYLYPVLKNAYGNVIDGFHRLQHDPEWPIKQLDHIKDPVQLAIARLIANACRRDVPPEEKTEWLRQIASMTGWTPKEIAENLPVSYTWVMKYIPDEFKERPGQGPSERPVTRRVTEKEARKFVIPGGYQYVTCTNCNVATGDPLEWKDKPVCPSCYEKLSKPEPRVGFEPTPPVAPGVPTVREPKPRQIDTGVLFECPECHEKLLIIHVGPGPKGHKFEKPKAVD